MAGRTFAIGDIHGDLEALDELLRRIPALTSDDTLVFLGDYVDRGPNAAGVVKRVRELEKHGPAKIVALRGNHEDAWLQVIDTGWLEFILPRGNGCLETYRSFAGKPRPGEEESPDKKELDAMAKGSFFPKDVVAWLRGLPFFYEDEHAIYVHAGLVEKDGRWLHPSETENQTLLLWVRTMRFFEGYRGKRVVCGHTSTDNLPPEMSSFTPEDPLDMWVGDSVIGIDTGCGKGGFLTCVELPARKVYESR